MTPLILFYNLSNEKGKKIRLANSQIYVEGFNALGATAVPMALGDVYTALQNGTLDGVENPLSTLYGQSFQEVTKNILMTGHILNFTTWCIGTDYLNTLTQEQQDLLFKKCEEAGLYNNEKQEAANDDYRKKLEDAGVTSGKIGIINVNAATDSCVMREEGFRSAFEGTDFELLETQYGEGDAAKSQSIAENYITQGVVGIFGCNEGSTTGAGNAIKASGKDNVIGVGFDKSDAILGLIDDGYLLCTMAQNPDVMGYEGVKAAVKAINGESLGGAVTDTGVSVLTKQQ